MRVAYIAGPYRADSIAVVVANIRAATSSASNSTPGYFKISKERIEATARQFELFD